MKASFPPFASCFPPWSCFARPRRLKSACHVARLVAAKPLRSDFRLLENALTNCCQHLRGGRLQLSPRGTLIADQRRTCAARPKGKYSRGRMALAPIRTREFFLPRDHRNVAFQFYSTFFHVTHRFFVTFFTEESNVPSFPSFPRPPHFPSPLRKKQRRGASSADAANNV